MASSLSDGWEIEASRLARRRMAFGLPVMLAVMVLAYVGVSVARGERVAFGGLFGFGFVLLIFGAVSAAIWYLCRPGIRSAFLSPIAVLPRADHKAALARIRTERDEPASCASGHRRQLAPLGRNLTPGCKCPVRLKRPEKCRFTPW